VPKAQLELKLASSEGDNKKFACLVVCLVCQQKMEDQRKHRSAIDEEGHLTDKHMGKAEMFNAFFASVFNAEDGLWDPACPDLEDHDSGNDKLPTNPERVRGLLFKPGSTQVHGSGWDSSQGA